MIGPGTLYAVAGAFGNMSPVELVARALGRAAVREAQWLRQRWAALLPSGPATGA